MDSTAARRRLQRLVFEGALLVLLGCVAGPATVAAEGPPALRVRSTDAAISTLIDRAATQSLTFRNLVALIQASDGMVYVEPGKCGHGTRACLKIWMQASGSTRFLRVMVERERSQSVIELMGSIGHELQHSVEALSEPTTVDGLSLYNFFRRTALAGDDRFETRAAIEAGNAVRSELGRR
jgi:hypothetical protein